jgi:hypothetical protein
MGGIPFSTLLSYILAHGDFLGNIGKVYPCVKGKQTLELPEFLVNTVVPESPTLLVQCILDTCPFLGYLLLPK